MTRERAEQIIDRIVIPLSIAVFFGIIIGKSVESRLARYYAEPVKAERKVEVKPTRTFPSVHTAPRIVGCEVAYQWHGIRTYRWTLIQTATGHFPEEAK